MACGLLCSPCGGISTPKYAICGLAESCGVRGINGEVSSTIHIAYDMSAMFMGYHAVYCNFPRMRGWGLVQYCLVATVLAAGRVAVLVNF
jgi:hypothetical protein